MTELIADKGIQDKKPSQICQKERDIIEKAGPLINEKDDEISGD